MEDTAYLSVRVPAEVRNRLKAVAASRGERLQDLIGGLVTQFLAEADRKPPELGEVLRRLRSIRDVFQARGVEALWVFGSVARGEARPDSDVDLTIAFAPGVAPSLFEIAHLKDEAEAVLGHSVDLGERETMSARAAAASAPDLVQVF